jgi:hypothetical protein
MLDTAFGAVIVALMIAATYGMLIIGHGVYE